MLDFCPHEPDYDKMDGSFKKIDMSNLAYEMKFRYRRTYEELKEKTVLGNVIDNIVVRGSDIHSKKIFNDDSTHFMLWEGRGSRENGLDMLRKAIEEANKEELSKQTSEFIGEEAYGGPQLLSFNKNPNTEGIYTISYAEGSDMAGTPIADLVPCCPNCHRPLPIGWQHAEAFQALSLMAYTSGGKTTFLVSMMADNWGCFNTLDENLHVSAAHDPEYEKWFAELKDASKRLVNNGECPDPTPPGNERIPALFLNVKYHGHRMILGLYDNAGETFKNMAPGNPSVIMLSCMNGHLFMIEPEDLHVQLPEKIVPKAPIEQYELMSIQEQAEYQSKHRNESVVAKDLLENVEKRVRRRRQDWFEMYSNMKDAFQRHEIEHLLQKQHLYGTVVKCDLLEDLPEFIALPQKSMLFSREDMDLNSNQMFLQQEMIREKIFERYVFRDEKQKNKLLGDFASASWHCISALGCDTKIIPGENDVFDIDAYAPIRLAEPIMTCVMNYAVDHGWD